MVGLRMLAPALAFAAVAFAVSLHGFPSPSRITLDQAELQAFLDEVLERFPNGTPRHVDSSGIAFQMAEDGDLNQAGMESMRVLLLERVTLPLDKTRALMDRGRIANVYRSARRAMHTSLQGFASLGNTTFMLASVKVVGGRLEADLLRPKEVQTTPGPAPEMMIHGSISMGLPNAGDPPVLVEGRMTLSQGDGVEVHEFFLLPFNLDPASIDQLSLASLNLSEIRARISEAGSISKIP